MGVWDFLCMSLVMSKSKLEILWKFYVKWFFFSLENVKFERGKLYKRTLQNVTQKNFRIPPWMFIKVITLRMRLYKKYYLNNNR